MEPIDETVLMAYVDGELDSESAAAVEARLEHDPDARAVVARFRATDGAMRSAIMPYGHAPVPDRLVDAIRAGAPRDAYPGRPGGTGWPRAAAALAAGLALVLLGSGGGYLVAEYRTATLQAEQLLARQKVEEYRRDAVQVALTTLVSGKSLTWRGEGEVHGRIVPLRTFKNRKGQFCREYRDEVTGSDGLRIQYGIACLHPDKVWRNNYLLIPGDQPDATRETQEEY